MKSREGMDFSDALEGPESADEILVDYLMDLCEMVHEHMAELGMNRKQLAEEMGVKPSRITKILSGESNVTLKTMAQLDYALDLGIHLRSGEGEGQTASASSSVVISLPSVNGGSSGPQGTSGQIGRAELKLLNGLGGVAA